MPKITVITPTVRPEGLALVAKALKRQTFKDFEWLISIPKERYEVPMFPGLDFWEATLIDPPRKEGDYWAVYKAYNQAVKKAQGELIVSWQDWTSAKPDALQKFWHHYSQNNKAIVSGVGNKYANDDFIVETWRDPRIREDQGTFYECYHNDIEWNFCAIPKAAIYEVGGFDEELDKYSSLCGLDVLQRLENVGGWKFYLDQTNRSFSLEHGRLPEWDEKTPFNGVWQKKIEEYVANPKLEYLS